MKREIYESPKAIAVILEDVDVITTSLPEFEDPNILDDGWIEA